MPLDNLFIDIARCSKMIDDLSILFSNGLSNSKLEEPSMEVLRYLWDQTNILYDLVQSRNESEGRSGRDYFDGVKLGELALYLSSLFQERKMKNPQEIALRIRLKAILQVQGHYHHIIGPAMLEHCAILEELGRDEEAQDNYNSVISDFLWILDNYTVGEKVENGEDVSLNSLKVALSKRIEVVGDGDIKEKLENYLNRVNSMGV